MTPAHFRDGITFNTYPNRLAIVTIGAVVIASLKGSSHIADRFFELFFKGQQHICVRLSEGFALIGALPLFWIDTILFNVTNIVGKYRPTILIYRYCIRFALINVSTVIKVRLS